MSIISYDPLQAFQSFLDDALFDRFDALSAPNRQQQRDDSSREFRARPRMDIYEHDNLVCATFELPGLTKEAVTIDLQNNKLTVSGEWPHPTPDKKDEGKSWAHRERPYGGLSRTINVPAGLTPQEIKASMENGILTVSFPKTTAEQTAKSITIN